VVIVIVIQSNLRGIECSLLVATDETPALSIFVRVTQILAEASLYATLLLIAKGWCIVRDSLSPREFLLAMLYSAAFIVFRFCRFFFYDSVVIIVCLLISLLALLLLLRELVAGIADTSKSIMAHMLAIANRGINPQTTPIYHKYRVYVYFQWVVIVAAVGVSLYFCLHLFVDFPYILEEALSDGIVIVVVAALCFIFRLRRARAGTYLRREDEEEAAARDGGIALEDLNGVDVNADKMRRGTEWRVGMKLPAQPQIVRQTANGATSLRISLPTQPDA
jgi:hypothetical protein